MKCWYCGLNATEHAHVSAILGYLDIEIESPDFSTDIPSFIVVGSDIDQLQLDYSVPVIVLTESVKLFGSEAVWHCPTPWNQKTLLPIIKKISKTRKLPRLYELDLNLHVRHLESLLIRQALLSSKGVVSKAAMSLQIQRTTLIEKMRRYKIDKSEF
ncbi:hypothetical protein CBF23_005720 [Marinomonas agarivorans]|nr:hypothetical protein CBF23_005720 [Marinomonas agarivorans]